MKFYILLPYIGKYRGDFLDNRLGYEVSLNTTVMYIKPDNDWVDVYYFSVSVLGFGVGVAWKRRLNE